MRLFKTSFINTLCVISLFASAVWTAPIHAEEKKEVPIPTTEEEAAEQRKQADMIRNQSKETYETEQNECYNKFLMNDCLAAAKKRYTEKTIEARELEAPAIEFQRNARRKKLDAHKAQKEIDSEQREIDHQRQSEEYRATEARKKAEREAKIAEKERKAAEGRQKAAEERAAREEKRAKRAKKAAENAEKRKEREGNNQNQ